MADVELESENDEGLNATVDENEGVNAEGEC